MKLKMIDGLPKCPNCKTFGLRKLGESEGNRIFDCINCYAKFKEVKEE